MALRFASSDDMLERPEPRDKKVVLSTGGNTTTLGKTDRFAPVQYVEPKTVTKGGPSPTGAPQWPLYQGMAVRPSLSFGSSGQKIEPTPIRDWANENVLRPVAGMAAATIGGMDPSAIFSQGETSSARLLDPFYDYYQAWKQRLGYDYDPNMHAVSEGFNRLQSESPLMFRQLSEGLIGAHPGFHGAPSITPQQFARYGMRPEFAPEPMPRSPGLQTPMREILAGASNTPEVPRTNRLKFAEEPGPGAPPPLSRYKNPTPEMVKADTTAEMNRLERNAPPPAQREPSPETRQRLETAMAGQEEKRLGSDIGPRGATELALKNRPHALAALDMAKNMEAEGKTRDEIWRFTSDYLKANDPNFIAAYKKTDGNWSVELSDLPSKWVGPTYTSRKQVATGLLPKFYEHPDFYEAYPQAKSSKVVASGAFDQFGLEGAYSPKDKSFKFGNPQVNSREQNVIHEGSHFTQGIEGFEEGTNPDAMKSHPLYEETVERYEKILAREHEDKYGKLEDWDHSTIRHEAEDNAAYELYHRSMGETSARTHAASANMTPEARRAKPIWERYDVPEKHQIKLGKGGEEQAALTAGQKARRAAEREQITKETPELRASLARATSSAEAVPIIDRLQRSTAISEHQRAYLNRLRKYVAYPNFMVRAYYRLTNGKFNEPVTTRQLYEQYVKEVKAAGGEAEIGKSKVGTEFYEKDLRHIERHVHTYGRRIGERFETQPTEAAPWLIDEQSGTVRLTPYIPDETGIRDVADTLPPEQGMRVAAGLPKPERMGPELTTGRQPKEAKHHREFQRLFTERFPTATRMMPGAPERGAKFPRPGAKKVGKLTEAEQQQQRLDEHRWYTYTWKPIEERIRGVADKFASGEISEQEYDMGVTKAFVEFTEANKAAPEYYAEGRGNFEDAAQEDVLRAIKQADKLRGYEVDDNLERRILSLTAKTGRGARGPVQHHIEHPRGLRSEADPRTSAARKPGARGPGDTGKGKIVSRAGAPAYPQAPKPRVLTEGPTLPSGAHEVKGPKGGKIGPRDPARALKGTWTPTGNPIKNAWHSVQAFLSPSTASKGARGAAQTMRAEIGEQKRHMAQQVQRLEGYRKAINALDPEAKGAIRDYLQGHEDVLPALKLLKAPWMSFVEAINDTRKAMQKQIADLPDYQKMEFEKNHLAQYWQESMRDRKKMAAKGHFIAKKYASYREGEAAGLHAKFDDPIKIVFQEMQDMANFLAKEHSLDALEKDNYAKRLGSKEREPVGTQLLQHVGKRRIYAAEDVARAWNNQWGPGVFENKDLGRLYMDTVRAMNASTAFTLGLSTKHAFNIAYGAIELNLQSFVKALAAGRPITAAKHLAGAAGAPYSLFRKGSTLHDVFTGAAAPKDARMSRIASLLAQSNMNVTEFEPIYRSSGNMNWVEAYKVGLLGKEFATDVKGATNLRKPLTAAGHTYNLVSKTMDSMMHPLFSYAIPRVKAGAFFMKMNDFMDSHPGATDWEKVQEAQRIADSIENVEGMMTQGNIMVAPLLKQAANLILQAPGWTFGALRAYGQGAADIAKGTAKLAMGKTVEALSENAAYTIAAALTTAGVCAFAQAIMGAGPPTSPLDLILPKTGGKNPDGSDERFSPFGNVKDLVGYYHDWKGELSNKVRGPWKAIYETITNHDWAKHVVADPMDPWQKQVKDVVGNILKNIGEPISIQQFGTATPGSALSNTARAAGFTPAGQWAANPQRTQAFERRNEVKEHRQRLRFERKQENQRAPVTNRLTFGKPEEAPRQRLRFAPQ